MVEKHCCYLFRCFLRWTGVHRCREPSKSDHRQWPVVNFINILQAAFALIFFRQKNFKAKLARPTNGSTSSSPSPSSSMLFKSSDFRRSGFDPDLASGDDWPVTLWWCDDDECRDRLRCVSWWFSLELRAESGRDEGPTRRGDAGEADGCDSGLECRMWWP